MYYEKATQFEKISQWYLKLLNNAKKLNFFTVKKSLSTFMFFVISSHYLQSLVNLKHLIWNLKEFPKLHPTLIPAFEYFVKILPYYVIYNLNLLSLTKSGIHYYCQFFALTFAICNCFIFGKDFYWFWSVHSHSLAFFFAQTIMHCCHFLFLAEEFLSVSCLILQRKLCM